MECDCRSKINERLETVVERVSDFLLRFDTPRDQEVRRLKRKRDHARVSHQANDIIEYPDDSSRPFILSFSTKFVINSECFFKKAVSISLRKEQDRIIIPCSLFDLQQTLQIST